MTRLIALMIATLAATVLLWLVVTLTHDATATETINATAATTTTTWASDPAPIPDLGPDFPKLIAPKKWERHRTVPPTRAGLFNAAYASEVAQIVRDTFGRFGATVVDKALNVFFCESHLIPTARNGQHVGVAQLARRWQEPRAHKLGFTWDQMTDARPNLLVAADLFAEQGWTPWACA